MKSGISLFFCTHHSCTFTDGISHRLLFDKSVQIKQLDVVEQHGILLFRAGDKGKESNVHVFRLSELEGDLLASMDLNDDDEEEDNLENSAHLSSPGPTSKAPAAKNRSQVKERKLERTRGCNLYSITRPGGSHLRMVCAFWFR